MDIETTILLQELQLADIDGLLATRISRTPEVTDYEYALQLQHEELSATLRHFTNLRLSRSMSGAIPDDTPLNTSDTDNAGEGSSRHVFSECVACNDRFPAPQGYTAPCDHVYCTGCTVRLFEDSLRDESLFPPRCCRQEMAIDSVQTILGAALTQRFNLRAIEHATPNKTYCHDPRCSRFILPDNILGHHGVCTECRTVTCVHCKQGAHNGDCEEAADTVFQALTQAQGWRDCYRCHAVVELNFGCNHITW